MNTVNKALIVFALLGLCFAAPAGAQDNMKKSDDFFDSGYADSPLKGNDRAKVPVPSGKKEKEYPAYPAKSKATPTPKKAANSGFKEMGVEEAPVQQENPSKENKLFARTIPVVAVGVILNTANKEHAVEKVSELIELSRRYKWGVSGIYTFGNITAALDKQDRAAIMAAGGSIRRHTALPERYSAVKLSPTWIVKTREGEILLEATGPLSQHFNAKGEIQFN